jgi:hypothetical protein
MENKRGRKKKSENKMEDEIGNNVCFDGDDDGEDNNNINFIYTPIKKQASVTCEDIVTSDQCITPSSNPPSLSCFWLYSAGDTDGTGAGSCRSKNDTNIQCEDGKRMSQCGMSDVAGLGEGVCVWVAAEALGSECQAVKASCDDITGQLMCEVEGAAKSEGENLTCFWLEGSSDLNIAKCVDEVWLLGGIGFAFCCLRVLMLWWECCVDVFVGRDWICFLLFKGVDVIVGMLCCLWVGRVAVVGGGKRKEMKNKERSWWEGRRSTES